MCAAGLQNKLNKLPGVSKAEVSYQDKRALIEFDPTLTARTRLVEAIEGDGFKVAGMGSPSGPSGPARSPGR
jgi:copper chaperone